MYNISNQLLLVKYKNTEIFVNIYYTVYFASNSFTFLSNFGECPLELER